MTITAEQKRLGLELCDRLEALPPEKFYFAAFVATFSCGTVGCAMGYADHWYGMPDLDWICRLPYYYRDMASSLFGVRGLDFDYLFIPHVGGEPDDVEDMLPEQATASQVTARFRAWIALQEVQP